MALSLNALQQGVRPVQPIDPTRRLKTIAEAQAMQQSAELKGLQIEGARGELDAQKQAQAKAAAVLQALEASGGDFAAALPAIKAIDPTFAMSVEKSLLDQENTRSTIKDRERDTYNKERESLFQRYKQSETEARAMEVAARPKPFEGSPGSQYGTTDPVTGKTTIDGTVPFAPKAPENLTLDEKAAAAYVKSNPGKTEMDFLRQRDQDKAQIARQNNVEPESVVNFIDDDGNPAVGIRTRGSNVITPLKTPSGANARPASNREQGRAVTSGDSGRIADFSTSLDDVNVLQSVLKDGVTGTKAKLGAITPNWVTNLTGWGEDAKSRQAVIDRVKQVIGKALEGGVLRKEDEVKYEKILPTIYDPKSVADSKLDGLKEALTLRRSTFLDTLEDSGYDVAKHRTRTEPAGPKGGGLEFDGFKFPNQKALDDYKKQTGQ